jgi:hypothetical protein
VEHADADAEREREKRASVAWFRQNRVRVFIRFKSKRATMYATQEKDEKWGKR